MEGNLNNGWSKNLSSAANYTFDGDSAQVTGMLMPAVVNNLTISNANGVTLSQATTINGTLTLTAGQFDNTIPFTLGPNAKISFGGGTLKIPVTLVPMKEIKDSAKFLCGSELSQSVQSVDNDIVRHSTRSLCCGESIQCSRAGSEDIVFRLPRRGNLYFFI